MKFRDQQRESPETTKDIEEAKFPAAIPDREILIQRIERPDQTDEIEKQKSQRL
jgi:hypothetical protein